ncbi:MAG: glycosyltransferase, partial [Actinobacteria bacterium]|nr:glycosyltransferase [Actinomycetota bacterium]
MTPRSAVPLARGERGRRSIALGALVLATVYLAWRWGFTLSVTSLWLGLPLILAETWGIAAMGLFTFSTWRLAERPTPPPPEDARVAIVINGHGEPADVLRATLLGALAVRHPSRPRVFVLDRSSRPWVAAMCRDVGATWVPAAGAASRWSGLNGVLPGVDAEFVFLLDGDHVLLPNAFERTLGYFSDPRVAFVQTPHVFYNRSFQHPRVASDPLDNEEGLFFDVVCRGKDRHGAVPWCGTSAIVRRSALLDIGGVATETSIDDTHTGMTLHARGWTSVYHPEIVAAGLAPDDVTSFLRRHGRRARGAFELMRRACPLLLRGLTWRQRLHYFASLSH